MDAARRIRTGPEDERLNDAASLRPEDYEKILRLPPTRVSRRPSDAADALTPDDVSAALDLVHEAAASLRDADVRRRDNEARTQAVLQRAADEVKAAETRAQAAEARIRAAETRAEEAENWLRQIFGTICEELPSRR